MRQCLSGSRWGAKKGPAPHGGESISPNGSGPMAGRQRAGTGYPLASSFIAWRAWKLATRKAPLPIPLCGGSSNGKPAPRVTQSASHTVKKGRGKTAWYLRLLNVACQVCREKRAGKGCGETRRGFLRQPLWKIRLLVRATATMLRPLPGSRVNTLQHTPKGRARRNGKPAKGARNNSG